jgi:hypothetical protein
MCVLIINSERFILKNVQSEFLQIFVYRYTLMAEFCGEAGRKYAFISGWVWWVFGMTGAKAV